MINAKFKRTPSTQDITWFIEKDSTGNLNLNPSYQRRSVWARKDKIFFLDTIFKGYPCPAIYLHKTMSEAGQATFHVVDGKQRLETILYFIKNRITLPKDFDNKNPDLAGRRWKDIPLDYKIIFWNYVLPVDQFDIVDESKIDEMFDRLNRNSKKLEAQELRHAKYDGWFIELTEKLSDDFEELKYLKIVTLARAKRMKDVQFISELLMVIIKKNVNGFSQDMINAYYAFYDDVQYEIEEIEDIKDTETNEYNLVRIEPEFIESDFKQAIKYIYQMNLKNECIFNYAKSFTHFYTLFALVVLLEPDNLEESDILAIKYENFMKSVKTYIDNPNDINNTDNDFIDYATCSSGASTDLPRRTGRLTALKNYMLNK
ncbi:MAG: hypothetical protein DRG78_06330 [Epsilonproteobacteria bacterium]|nr:MAG: hypothetical protein DRG78_06330 [Campylobacterota bacterium]